LSSEVKQGPFSNEDTLAPAAIFVLNMRGLSPSDSIL
jgi:hypothetical protein